MHNNIQFTRKEHTLWPSTNIWGNVKSMLAKNYFLFIVSLAILEICTLFISIYIHGISDVDKYHLYVLLVYIS